jgi:dCTP diphosphatase
LIYHLHQAATSLDLDLLLAIEAKLELNKLKYPVELCKGKAGKYTQYSKVTGVTATNQSTLDRMAAHQAMPLSAMVERIPAVAQEIAVFAEARRWAQFHTPRNLILALLGEVGELAELVQWKGDELQTPGAHDDPDTKVSSGATASRNRFPLGLTSAELDKISQELADVAIYSLRIATVCDIVDPVRNVLQDFVPIDEEDAAPQRSLAQDPSFGKD